MRIKDDSGSGRRETRLMGTKVLETLDPVSELNDDFSGHQDMLLLISTLYEICMML